MGSDLLACPLSTQFLAMVFQDLLTNKDDYLRASRALLREIIKQTKHEVNFQAFCLGLMQERKEPQYLDMEFKVTQPAFLWAPAASPAISGWRPVWPVPEVGLGSIMCEDSGGPGCMWESSQAGVDVGMELESVGQRDPKGDMRGKTGLAPGRF